MLSCMTAQTYCYEKIVPLLILLFTKFYLENHNSLFTLGYSCLFYNNSCKKYWKSQE